MPLTLNALLADSSSAVASGRTAWPQMNEFARFHWLSSATEVEESLRGEYYFLRAGVADVMGMADDMIASLRSLSEWAKSHDDHATSLIAAAHLAFQALNQDEPSVYPLRPAEDLLKELLADVAAWRPDPDSATIGEDSSMTGESIPRSAAMKLTTTATTAYTTAINIDTELAEHFAVLVRRFGVANPSAADRKLWFAQQHWFAHRHEQAISLAREVADDQDYGTVATFDAYDMLGHFALLADDELGVAEYWGRCVELARDMGASVIAMRHAELTSRVLFAHDRQAEAWRLASETLEAVSGVPVGPVLLDLQEVVAQSALEKGLNQEAWDTARSVIHWSEMSPNDERTSSCYAIATFAGLKLGLTEEVFDLQHRRSDLLEEGGRLLEASEVMQSLAFLDHDAAGVYMDRAWELLQRSSDAEWHIAEWHLTMAQLSEGTVEHAERAAELFSKLGNPIKEAFSWLAAAQRQLDYGETDLARQAYALANLAMPESHGRPDGLDGLFDQVREQLN